MFFCPLDPFLPKPVNSLHFPQVSSEVLMLFGIFINEGMFEDEMNNFINEEMVRDEMSNFNNEPIYCFVKIQY